MKKTVFSLLFLLSCVTGFAQTESGSWLLGGTASLGSLSSGGSSISQTNLSLLPTVGYFVIDNLAIGASLPITYSSFGSSSSTSVGIGPLGRYFFLPGKVKPFLQAQGGYVSTSISNTGQSYSISGTTFGAGGGLAIFLTKSAALDLSLNYSSTSLTASGSSVSSTASNFGLQVGFLVYLSKGNKD